MSVTTYASVSWEHMTKAVECVQLRLLRAGAANIDIAIAGGVLGCWWLYAGAPGLNR